ncbi:NUDIX hydrolase [Actinophytocola sp. KF-1]
MPEALPMHSVSVAGVVIDSDERILAIRRRDNDHWQIPGGILEVDESFEEGVRREIMEETGVAVTVQRLTGVYKNMSSAVVALVFQCSPINGQPAPTAETVEACWLTPDEVDERMVPAFAIRVQDAFSSDVRTRTHDGVDLNTT